MIKLPRNINVIKTNRKSLKLAHKAINIEQQVEPRITKTEFRVNKVIT